MNYLPDRSAFAPFEGVYLDSGAKHPLPRGAELAARAYLRSAAIGRHPPQREINAGIREAFARMINAKPAEVALTTSTTDAEQMIIRGLGLPHVGGCIVTDVLHFPGSRPIYMELQSQGLDVVCVRATGGRVLWRDMRKAIRKGTTLVVVSAISSVNGFQHEMQRLCRHAHAHGALVYADIIQAAGCSVIDVNEWGVDFAACSSYKYLMADYGLGFVYARDEALQRLRRTEFGRYGLAETVGMRPEGLHPGRRRDAWIAGAEGQFARGTLPRCVAAQLAFSLRYIEQISVSKIQSHAVNLGRCLRRELKSLRLKVITPEDSTGPIVTFLPQHPRRVERVLADRGIRVTQRAGQIRVTTSVFNDERDIEAFLSALTYRRRRASLINPSYARSTVEPTRERSSAHGHAMATDQMHEKS
jgi:selenocysteine lyase/cysteine desulfurase